MSLFPWSLKRQVCCVYDGVGLQARGGAEAQQQQQQQQLSSGGGRGLRRLEPQDGEPGAVGGVEEQEEEGANISNAAAEIRTGGTAGG